MKVLKRDLKQGLMVLQVQTLDDMWYLSHIISSGDYVKTKTYRRIKDKDDSRSKGGQRKAIVLKLLVEKTEFSVEAETFRVSGVIEEGPEDLVSIGSHHTFNVELDSNITVIKERWDPTVMARVKDAVESTLKAKVLVCVMDRGEATFALIRDSSIKYIDLAENVGGKFEKEIGSDKFYDHVMQALERTISEHDLQAVIVAGPGFEKNNFHKYLSQKSFTYLDKIRVDDCSMGGSAGVNEILKRESFQKVIGEMQSAKDISYMQKVLEEIGKDSGLSVYSIGDVTSASMAGAVETLLVSDVFFNTQRGKVEKLFSYVKKTKGNIHILNSEGDAGKQLDSLSGIAAILRYKIN